MEKKVSLYLVATPIGNRGDFSPRAQEILSSVDFIAAEDTRTSGVLLSGFGIKRPMVSYFDHNRRTHGEKILARLKNGETCALITDAGMPAISDPGEDLVAMCHAEGLTVSAVPGPCAFVTALALSGLPTRRFAFEGFLPTEKKPRRQLLEELKNETRTLIFYEAPHRVRDTLAEFRETFGGDRRICCVRELTKIYEEALLSTLDEACARAEQTEPRGEFVLVLQGAAEKEPVAFDEKLLFDVFREKAATGMTKTAAAKEIAREYGWNRREIYEKIKDL